MKSLLKLYLFFCIAPVISQTTDQLNIEKELQAINNKADLIFQYRMAEWWGSEFTEKDKELDEQVADYIIYHDAEKLYFVLIGHSKQHKIGTYSIEIENEDANIQFDPTQKKLNRLERRTYQIQNKINTQVYDLVHSDLIDKNNFSPSIVLIKQRRGYRVYLLSNTSNLEIVPLGNDAVFYANNRGKIKKWHWYHKELLPIPANKEGKQITTHKHSDSSFLISPTEIANFRLYGVLYDKLEMSILNEKNGLMIVYDTFSNQTYALYPKAK